MGTSGIDPNLGQTETKTPESLGYFRELSGIGESIACDPIETGWKIAEVVLIGVALAIALRSAWRSVWG